jgi:hypothetical protein
VIARVGTGGVPREVRLAPAAGLGEGTRRDAAGETATNEAAVDGGLMSEGTVAVAGGSCCCTVGWVPAVVTMWTSQTSPAPSTSAGTATIAGSRRRDPGIVGLRQVRRLLTLSTMWTTRYVSGTGPSDVADQFGVPAAEQELMLARPG